MLVPPSLSPSLPPSLSFSLSLLHGFLPPHTEVTLMSVWKTQHVLPLRSVSHLALSTYTLQTMQNYHC